MNRKKCVFLIIAVSLVVLLLFWVTNKQIKSTQVSNNTIPNTHPVQEPTSPPLGSAITFKNFFVHFGKDQVLITSFEGQPNNKGGILEKSEYPELFRAEGGGEFFLTAREVNDKVHGKQFVYISKDVFSHGAYVDVYGVIFDPAEGTVVYITPKELAISSLGDIYFIENDSIVRIESYAYYFHDACTSCKLRVIDYQGYDPKLKKFISINSNYKNDFQALLDEYNKIALTRCSYNGKITPVTEVQKMAGDNAKCDDLTIPSQPRKAPNYYINVGQFLKIKDNIQQVINGQKDSMITKDNPF